MCIELTILPLCTDSSFALPAHWHSHDAQHPDCTSISYLGSFDEGRSRLQWLVSHFRFVGKLPPRCAQPVLFKVRPSTYLFPGEITKYFSQNQPL